MVCTAICVLLAIRVANMACVILSIPVAVAGIKGWVQAKQAQMSEIASTGSNQFQRNHRRLKFHHQMITQLGRLRYVKKKETS